MTIILLVCTEKHSVWKWILLVLVIRQTSRWCTYWVGPWERCSSALFPVIPPHSYPPTTYVHVPRTQSSMWFYSWLKIGFWLFFFWKNSFLLYAGWSAAVTCSIRHRLKRKGAIFTLVGADAVLLSSSFSVCWRLASLIIWSAQLGQPLSDYLDIFCSTVDSWIPGDWYRIQEDHGELVQVCSYIIHRTWNLL